MQKIRYYLDKKDILPNFENMKGTKILSIDQFKDDSSHEELFASSLSYHLTHHHNEISVPHKHDFYTTLLFTHGSGTHEIDFETYDVTPGSVFLLNPGQMHYWELSPDAEGFVFLHSESFYNFMFSANGLLNFPFFRSTHNSPYLLLDNEELTKITPFFDQIITEYQDQAAYKFRKIVLLIDLVYIELSRIYEQKNHLNILHNSNNLDKLMQFETLINTHYQKEKSASQYAKWMNITPKHLNRICQQTVAKTTTELIANRVILEAKRLISNPSINLTDISEILGFEDYAYFSRLFKKYTQETPIQFRNRYIQ